MTRRLCYLDYNAGAPLKPAVAAAMAEILDRPGNPSSVHRYGRLARRAIEDARESVAALVGASSSQIVFTGSGTEANNLALRGCGARRLVVSAVEHDSVLRAAPGAARVAVDGHGVIDLSALEAILAESDAPTLVSVMRANNETGVVQPVPEVAAVARAHGALVHCDAVQAAGKIAVDVAKLGADLVTLSAHKLGGPQGVGALFVDDRVALEPQLRGGGQEMGRRAGTENVAGIVGFGTAASLAAEDLDAEDLDAEDLDAEDLDAADLDAEDLDAAGRLAALRDDIERRLRAVAPEIDILGGAVARLPNTTCITMPGVSSETQVMALDLAGVSVSAGAACSSGKVEASHVLAAMGVAADVANCAIRISLGWATTVADVDRLVEAWRTLHARTRLRAARSGQPSSAA